MLPILDLPTARRAAIGERDCYVDWSEALRAAPGNPWRAEFRDFGAATAIVCPGNSAQIVNRCFGLDRGEIERVPEILAFFSERGIEPRFDLEPYADYGRGGDFFAKLAGHGLAHNGFHQMLVGYPRHGDDAEVETAPDVTIDAVGAEAEADFAMIHERVWGPGLLISVLVHHPAFHCFLARVDGQPAALGVLHVRGNVASMANGITLPEFRGRGLQRALLCRRVALARGLGCDLIVSQAEPRGISMRNQQRSGLSIAGTKAIWERMA